MKTLVIGAGPLGSLCAARLHQAGHDVTLLARNERFEFLKENGVVLVNEFDHQTEAVPVKVMNALSPSIEFHLVIVMMRKNRMLELLPSLSACTRIDHILFMGNNTLGFDQYIAHLPKEKIVFGFPGGGGSLINQVVHYVDSEQPNGDRMPFTLGEMDGQTKNRSEQIKHLFQSSCLPIRVVDDIDSWFKYHIAFVLPLAGALLKTGDNYKLSKDKSVLKEYVLAVREAGRILKSLGHHKSYNPKFKLFYWLPAVVLTKILSKVFSTKFSEVAMMMHVKAAGDEMALLAQEFRTLENQSPIKAPSLNMLLSYLESTSREDIHEPQALLLV